MAVKECGNCANQNTTNWIWGFVLGPSGPIRLYSCKGIKLFDREVFIASNINCPMPELFSLKEDSETED